MSSNTEQLLKEHSRSLRLIEKNLCCAITSIEDGVGNNVFLKGIFDVTINYMPSLTIDADTAGTYESLTSDGASGTFTIDLNGGGDVAFSFPLVLSIGDTIIVKRSISVADGWFKITGTY